jgi:hypothetical protein
MRRGKDESWEVAYKKKNWMQIECHLEESSTHVVQRKKQRVHQI